MEEEMEEEDKGGGRRMRNGWMRRTASRRVRGLFHASGSLLGSLLEASLEASWGSRWYPGYPNAA